MFEKFFELVEGAYRDKKISQACYEDLKNRTINNLDELEMCNLDFQQSLKNAEYFTLLERIVKGAEYLDNPLINEIDHAKGMKLYDKIVGQAHEYHRENPIEDRVRTKSA